MKNIKLKPLTAGKLVIEVSSEQEAVRISKAVQESCINGMTVSYMTDDRIIVEYDAVMLRFLPIEPASGEEAEEYRKIKRVIEDIIFV